MSRTTFLDKLDGWLTEHLSALALIPIVAFTAVAFYRASLTYLHPDEAQQFLRAAMPSLDEAFRASLSQSHPPLYILFLYGILKFARGALFLRGASILAAAGALWLVFAWVRRALDERSAAAALVIMATSPPLLIVAPQLRQYGLVLFFIAAALYSLERMFERRSIGWTVAFSLAEGAALFTFYGAAWVAVSLGIYVPLRLARERVGAAMVATWALFQGLFVAMAGWLYVHQLRHYSIKGAAFGFLRGSFHTDKGSAWAFAATSTFDVFQYFAHGFPLRQHAWLGILLLVLFLIGVASAGIPFRRARPGLATPMREYGVLLLLPVVLACLGALKNLLPFGGTRHVSYLLPFIAAGAGIALARGVRQLWPIALMAIVMLALRLGHDGLTGPPPRVSADHAISAIEYIRANIPNGTTVFTDRQGFYLLRYYLAADRDVAPEKGDRSTQTDIGDYRLISPPTPFVWTFTRSTLERSLVALSAGEQVDRGTPVWVVSHSVDRRALLRSALPADATYRQFGAFEIFQVPFPGGR